MSRRGVEDFLAGFIAHNRYGEKPRKAQQAAARQLAERLVEKIHELPEDPIVKTRKRVPRQTR